MMEQTSNDLAPLVRRDTREACVNSLRRRAIQLASETILPEMKLKRRPIDDRLLDARLTEVCLCIHLLTSSDPSSRPEAERAEAFAQAARELTGN